MKKCIACGKPHKNSKFCSMGCRTRHAMNKAWRTREPLLDGRHVPLMAGAIITGFMAKKFLGC